MAFTDLDTGLNVCKKHDWEQIGECPYCTIADFQESMKVLEKDGVYDKCLCCQQTTNCYGPICQKCADSVVSLKDAREATANALDWMNQNCASCKDCDDDCAANITKRILRQKPFGKCTDCGEWFEMPYKDLAEKDIYGKCPACKAALEGRKT